MNARIYVGTSGWHYQDWLGTFYPAEITGYHELTFHAQHFTTVENNSSFYRIASAETYKTWDRMTPEDYKFSIKLNKLITHTHRLELTDQVKERIEYILNSTQVLEQKLGAILIQLPASFRFDIERLAQFLDYFTHKARTRKYVFDIAIEFRNKYWFVDSIYELLAKHNIALVTAQSSRYPSVRHITADSAYFRFHGPEKLFASSYSLEELTEWASYITETSKRVSRIYIYFNNDFHGYAIKNAQQLLSMLRLTDPKRKGVLPPNHEK